MSDAELQTEWRYRLLEREGILADGAPPTRQETAIAWREADAWLKAWRSAPPVVDAAYGKPA